MIKKPTAKQINLYINLMLLLNNDLGDVDEDSAAYFSFLDKNMVEHTTVLASVNACGRYFALSGKFPRIYYFSPKNTKLKSGKFCLSYDGNKFVYNLNRDKFPNYVVEEQDPLVAKAKAQLVQQKQQIKITDEQIQFFKAKVIQDNQAAYNTVPDKYKDNWLKVKVQEYIKNNKTKSGNRSSGEWTKEDIVHLLTCEAHIVGRMLGQGYDLLEPIHGEWIHDWVLNPNGFKIAIHQAHRGSFKSSSLKLAIAILMILKPLTTIIVLRKAEDAVKECIAAVSKILDTPLFATFVNILYPDINKKGGFKKTTDTALAIDTNLNVNLSGEPQLRGLGLGSALTGKHSELIITDDVCTKIDRESAAARQETILAYQELMNILSTNKNFKDSRILNIGTPWHEEDVFSLMKKGLVSETEEQKELEEIPQKERTLEQNERIRQLNKDRGLSVYNCYQTGLMTEKDIEWQKQVLNDDVLFAANYLLTLVSDDEKPFPRINNVGNYSKAFFADAWEVFAQIDASYGGEDSTTLTIGAFNWETNETICYGKLYRQGIDKIYPEVAEEMFNCGVGTTFMETNADKGLMGQKFRELGFNVVSYHESMNKHSKIIGTIRPFWREKGDEVMPCVQFVSETDADYLTQVYNYKKGVRHDDAPDSLASLLIKAKFGVLAVRVF